MRKQTENYLGANSPLTPESDLVDRNYYTYWKHIPKDVDRRMGPTTLVMAKMSKFSYFNFINLKITMSLIIVTCFKQVRSLEIGVRGA